MADADDVRKAWAAWDGMKPMTPEQMHLLREDENGNRIMPRAIAKGEQHVDPTFCTRA